ncbi:MAG TPA: GNAT family protein [Streptomyces sp.]|nr:GNAT family protein [Streptomyces sp.]
MLRRFHIEPGLIPTDWHGYRDPRKVDRRFAEDAYLGTKDGRLMVDVQDGPTASSSAPTAARNAAATADILSAAAAAVGRDAAATVGRDAAATVGRDAAAAGFVTWSEGRYSGVAGFFEIGIVLVPEFRGRGIGWRAQAMIADYLFEHTPAQRIQAGTQPENIAEQKSLLKAGFRLEGVVRAAEFRAGRWRDCLLYSRLRTDPPPR